MFKQFNEIDIESRTSTEQSNLQNENEEVELILKPHPKEINHDIKRFLKTTANATGKIIEKIFRPLQIKADLR